jgi:hypothetical protein
MPSKVSIVATMSTWEDCEPQDEELPIFHPGLKIMLAIGTFVLYDGGKVGRVLSRMSEGYQPNDSKMITEFPLLRYSTLNIRLNPSAVHHEVYQSSIITFVQEMGLIESVAWVFPPSKSPMPDISLVTE